MSCQRVRKSISGYLDRVLDREETEIVSRHLAYCRTCAVYADEIRALSGELAGMRTVPVPDMLQHRLRVLASRESVRQMRRVDLPARRRDWRERGQLMIDNLMRPLAVPFAGGLLSALFLFAALVPTLGFRHNIHNDVPTALYTQPSLEEFGPFRISNDETVVELVIDERGQAADYSIPHGNPSPELTATITNMMLYSKFTPATLFGQPTYGRVLVKFGRSRIVVPG